MSLSGQSTSYPDMLKIDNAPPIKQNPPRTKPVKAGKNLKPLSNHNTLGKLPTIEEPNQEVELDFAGPLPLVWGTKKYILVCVDRFSKFPSAQITSSTSAKSIINFLSKYIGLMGYLEL